MDEMDELKIEPRFSIVSRLKIEPRFSIDGNQWCCMVGPNLQEGVAGFGDTPADAYEDFLIEWNKPVEEYLADRRPIWGSPSWQGTSGHSSSTGPQQPPRPKKPREVG